MTLGIDILSFPIALGVIVFSYTSQIFVCTLEGNMLDRSKFHCMLNWSHVAAAVFKALFGYVGFVTFQEVSKSDVQFSHKLMFRSTSNDQCFFFEYPRSVFLLHARSTFLFRTIYASRFKKTNYPLWPLSLFRSIFSGVVEGKGDEFATRISFFFCP